MSLTRFAAAAAVLLLAGCGSTHDQSYYEAQAEAMAAAAETPSAPTQLVPSTPIVEEKPVEEAPIVPGDSNLPPQAVPPQR